MPSLNDLIRSAQSGDSIAVEALVKQYSGLVRQECAKFGLKNHADMSHSDLVQEVLLQVWTKIYQFKGGDDDEQTTRTFQVWIQKNARSTLINLFRNRQAQKRMPEGGVRPFDEAAQEYDKNRVHQSGPSSIFSKAEEDSRLREAIHQCLDKQSREIVQRHIVEGQSFKEIAEQMSLTYDQVRYAYHTARTELAKWIT